MKALFINRNLNPKKIKKTPEKGRFLSIVTHAITSTSSIKWTSLIDTGYRDGSLFRILCKCLFSEVTVQAVTELDNKAAHCHSPALQRHRPFLGRRLDCQPHHFFHRVVCREHFTLFDRMADHAVSAFFKVVVAFCNKITLCSLFFWIQVDF